MEYRRMLFVVNRYAGKSKITASMTDVLDHFVKCGYMPTIHITQGVGDATRIVREMGEGYPLVVCSGGDGTLSEVVAGALSVPPERRPALGYIPAGSTNDFAATLALPADMLACASVITEGSTRKLDAGCFGNDRSFVYVAAFGTFTETSYATPQREKNLLGYNAYILHGLKELTNIRSYQMSISLDDVRYDGDFLFGMVSNANSVGGLHQPSGIQAVLDDGQMEVMLVRRPETAAEWPQLLTELLAKKSDGRYLITGRARKIVFDCQNPIDWVLDGEHGGTHQKATVQVQPQAVDFVLPAVLP